MVYERWFELDYSVLQLYFSLQQTQFSYIQAQHDFRAGHKHTAQHICQDVDVQFIGLEDGDWITHISEHIQPSSEERR